MTPLIAALLGPARYPHPVRAVRLIETHISWVLLAGRYAYKIKKPLDLGFLDFSTLAARKFCCDEELRLNRRLAPELYLEVVPIGGAVAAPQLGTEPAFEYAVRMRRFPATRLMDRLLAAGRVTPQHIDALALRIARFHAALPAAVSGHGAAATIHATVQQNFAALRQHAPHESDFLDALQTAFTDEFARCQPLFAERLAAGRVRECHGDLHLGNIVLLKDGPTPFDCIEFNPEFRWVDVISEIAFTVMDLLHRQHPALAWRLLDAYLATGGDYAGVALLRYYLAYRAMVRAKVAAIRACQPDLAARSRQRERAECHAYLDLAQRSLGLRRPAILLTHGLPGSGKSTFAQAALERFGGLRIRSDVERKRLYGLEPLADSRAVADLYHAEATARTYARLEALTETMVRAGFPVIVDAAFLRREERQRFRALAERLNAPFAIASLQANTAELQRRILARQAQGGDPSEADLAVLDKLSRSQQPLDADERACTVEFAPAALAATAPAWQELARRCGFGG